MRWSFVLLAVVVSLGLAGCGRAVTPAELDQYETRTYSGRSGPEVFRATVTALKSLGYEVVLVEESSGRVKTAPKIVVVHAAAVGSGHAIAASDSVAWTIDVASAKGGAVVHATPRPYSAGQAIDPSQLNSDFASRTFTTLYSEIESNLDARTTTASVQPTEAKPKPAKAKAVSKPRAEPFQP